MGPLPKFTANFYADKLIHAVVQGRIHDAGRLLSKGADANQRDEFGCSAITHAAEAGHLEVMGLLLEAGAQVKADDAALFQACCRSGLQAARVLYRHLPDGQSRDMFLVAAAAAGSLELVAFLVERRADVSAADCRGWTALMMASMEGHVHVTRFLLDHGAAVNSADKYGCTALMAACQFGRLDVAALLIDRHANVNSRALGSPVLLSKYGDPENWFPPGMTALSWACRNGHDAIVELLLAHGSSVDVSDGGGWTPLMWAALGGHASIVETLLVKGAAPCASTTAVSTGLFAQATTGLMMAAHRGHAHVVTLLVDGGAAMDAKDRNGKTALMFAARQGRLDTVRVFLDRGAAIDERNDEGLSALAYALIERHMDVAEALREKGASEPLMSREPVSLKDKVHIPWIARVDKRGFGSIALVTATGLAIIAMVALFWAYGHFSSGSALGLLLGLALIAAGAAAGLMTQFTRLMAESRRWDPQLPPRIGRAATIGGLTLTGCVIMIFQLYVFRTLSDKVTNDFMGVTWNPAFLVCAGALILAFICSGKDRFSVLRIMGLAVVFLVGGLVPSMDFWRGPISHVRSAAIFLGIAAFILLYMVLMVKVGEDSVILDRSLSRMIARGVLLLPVVLALTFWLLNAMGF